MFFWGGYKMLDNMLRKGLVFAVIVLFVGTSFTTVTGNILDNNKTILIEKQGLYNDLIFDRLITFLMKLGHMPSLSTCIIKNSEVVWSRGYGLYDIEHNKAASDDTIYAVASISKTVTATALMQLYDQGLFDLDDDINDYLNFSIRNPNYPGDPISFRMLLSHRSSLAEDPWQLHKEYPGDCPIPFYPFLKEYLTPGGSEYSPEVWADCHPGEEFHYANMGYAIIGHLVERITGQPFDQYCKDHIFLPLNMSNASFRFADIDKERLAIPYIYCFWGYEPYMHAGDVDYPSGCLRTSVMELSHFLVAHLNGGVYNGVRILEEDTIELMHTAQYPDGSQYGLGWQIWENRHGEIFIGHGGGNIGVSTVMKVRVSDNVSVIYFINRMITLYTELTAGRIIERLLFLKAIKL